MKRDALPLPALDDAARQRLTELRDGQLIFGRQVLAEPPQPPSFWREGWRRCAEVGLLRLLFDEGPLAHAVALEALGEACPDRGLLFAIGAQVLAGGVPLWRFGEGPRHAELLEGLASGAQLVANAVSEPASGSDAFAMQTRATRDGDGYRLCGEKCYVTLAPLADWLLTYAVTEPAHGLLGISAFAVPADRAGVEVVETPKQALLGVPMGHVRFSDVRIEPDERIGAEGAGARIFEVGIGYERALILAPFVGGLNRQLARLVEELTGKRRRRGRLIDQQSVAHRLAELELRRQSARMWLYHAAATLEGARRLEDYRSIACQAKLYIGEALCASSAEAVQLSGARGILAGAEAFAEQADAAAVAIASGPSALMRELIAAELIPTDLPQPH